MGWIKLKIAKMKDLYVRELKLKVGNKKKVDLQTQYSKLNCKTKSEVKK